MTGQNPAIEFLGLGELLLFFELRGLGNVQVVLVEFHEFGLQRLCFVHLAQNQQQLPESHTGLLSLGIEFQGLAIRIDGIVYQALRHQQFRASLIRTSKLRIERPGALDALIGIGVAAEFDQRAGRQAQEVGVVRLPAQNIRANRFGRRRLTALQKALRFLKPLCA